ncbi:tyrosine-type recombinase/integrase [Oenococcus kitaharae]|uniref:Phage integrase n=1 Tax=Oenococcus kitaharae DSM 17330 TaxID=1045004 RepID=G9WFD3_9LACO|nr:site-specific integrase [Oenococcus kitaharae]EHN59090.1 Phage integrase [Oenococcus kitaharae DSM 17330]OEY82025.1 integrase [Oenococcus kitaharae]OEY82396.1 integrase [Oenococcus kitaharae]OEY82802.1 integrase [Oenococcus kitaharae]
MKIKNRTLKNGVKSYYFRIVLNGKPTTKRGFSSRKEAVNAYRAYKVAEANGQLESQQVKRIKFNELATEWLAMKAKEVKPSTYKKIEERYKLHIQPYFKGMYLDELTPIKAQKFVNQLASKLVGYTDSLDIVNQVYKKAVQYGYVKTNPFANVDKPKAKKAPSSASVKFYDVEQLRRFLNSAYQLYNKDHYSRYLFFRLLAFTGMRKGEALALNWDDVDLANKTLSISKTVVTVDSGEIISEEPKTKASNRLMTLDDDTVSALAEWKLRQHDLYKALGYDSSPCSYVFNSEVNSFISLSRPRAWARAIAKAADLPPIIIHGFRHTYATLAVQSGMDIKQLQYQLGHNDVHTTLQIYAEVTNKQKTETAKIFANFVNQSTQISTQENN